MTLMILAHPNINDSIANKTISESLQQHLPNIETRNIHQLYSNYQIDVEAEQAALLRHDLIVLQYPMYWFNMPAILKIWFDSVFAYKFAYGSQGNKLKGKKLLISLTVGQPEQNFQLDDQNTINNFLQSVKKSAIYAQMNYLEPIILYGVSTVSGNTREDIIQKSLQHSQQLQKNILNES